MARHHFDPLRSEDRFKPILAMQQQVNETAVRRRHILLSLGEFARDLLKPDIYAPRTLITCLHRYGLSSIQPVQILCGPVFPTLV